MLSIRIEQPRRPFTVRVHIEVPEGRTYCVFGPSGAGKSTILSVTAGFQTLHKGHIALNGTVLADHTTRLHLPAWRRQLGYLAQSPLLFPHLDVQRNIAYALPNKRLDDYSRNLVKALELQDYLFAGVNTLSGGQKQRVALGRALAARPRALLLDEPFSALDHPARLEMQELLLSLQKEYRLTMLLVTHQLTEAQRLANTLGVLDEGEILQEVGPAELVVSPVSVKVALLAGYRAFLPAALFGLEGGLVALHPDRVHLGSDPAMGPVGRALVESCYPHEGRWLVGLRLAQGQTLEATANQLAKSQVGREVSFTLQNPPVLAG